MNLTCEGGSTMSTSVSGASLLAPLLPALLCESASAFLPSG